MKKSIWNYFIKINEEKIKCLECNQEFNYKNSTSSFRYHLLFVHKINNNNQNNNNIC